jgi:hypothetical protein
LQEIAANSRHVPYLRGCARQQGFGNGRGVSSDQRVLGNVTHAGERANRDAVCTDLDRVERQSADIDDEIGRHDADFPQLHQVRSAGDER